jgi:hypothetical protein
MDEDLRAALARGVADRTRTLLLTLNRQDRLESADVFVDWLGEACAHRELDAPAREMFLRALRAAGDPINFEILAMLEEFNPVELPAVMERTGLHRVAASERVNDLAQAGLCVREMINDEIRGTTLGVALVALISDVASTAGSDLVDGLTPDI